MNLFVGIKAIFGFVALLLGVIGLCLPIWPTTPFVLVAVGCFSTMPNVRERLLKIGFIREYYEGYTEKKGVSIKTLIVSLCFLWGMLGISAAIVGRWMIVTILFAVGLAVTIHLLWMARPTR